MEHEHPDVHFFLDTLAGSLLVDNRRRRPLAGRLSLLVVQHKQMGNGESDRVTVGEDPSSKKRTFSQTLLVFWEEARCGSLQVEI